MDLYSLALLLPSEKNSVMRWENSTTASFGLMDKKCRQAIFRWKHESILLELNSEPTWKSKNRHKNTFSRKICFEFSKKSLEDALPCRCTQSLKTKWQTPISNLQTPLQATCAPTGVLRMLWVGTVVVWGSIRVNEMCQQSGVNQCKERKVTARGFSRMTVLKSPSSFYILSTIPYQVQSFLSIHTPGFYSG